MKEDKTYFVYYTSRGNYDCRAEHAINRDVAEKQTLEHLRQHGHGDEYIYAITEEWKDYS